MALKLFALSEILALIFDFDKTLYNSPEYLAAGEEGEIRELAKALSMTYPAALERFNSTREMLAKRADKKISRTATILHLGFDMEWWNNVREKVYEPEKYLQKDLALVERITKLSLDYKWAIVSNSPTALVKKALHVIGFTDPTSLTVLGASDGEPKPSPDLFIKAAGRLNVPHDKCLSIGDRFSIDALPAIMIGMGAVIVDDMADLFALFDSLILGSAALTDHGYNLSRVLGQYKPGEVTIAGFTGQAGAGKTTAAEAAHLLGEGMGIPTHLLSLDSFFILSSEDRRDWLAEGKALGADEYAIRSDQMNWWNFDALQRSLQTLQRGESLHLEGVYNRGDQGRKTLDITIPVDKKKGLLVLVEGVAIAHMPQAFSNLTHLHVPRFIRQQRLTGRDQHREGSAAYERFQLTQRFETRYFGKYLGNANLFVENTAVPTVMPTPPSVSDL